MRRRLLVVACLAGGLLACQRSVDDPVFFFGTVRNTAGVPLAETEVRLFRGEGNACWSGRWILGLPQSTESTNEWHELGSTLTGTDGTFLMRLWGFQVMKASGVLTCFRAELPVGPSGATGQVRFHGFPADVVVDQFQRWDDGEASWSQEGEAVVLQVARLPIPSTESAEYTGPVMPDLVAYEWELRSGEQVLWRQEASLDPWLLPSSMLEDFEGALTARVSLLGAFNPPELNPFTGVRYDLRSQLAPMTLEVPRTLPVSRNAWCGLGAEEQAPCALTDGSLEPTDWDAPYDSQLGTYAPLEFQLAESAHLAELVMRGFQWHHGMGPVVIEGSTDGTLWLPLGQFRLYESDVPPRGYDYMGQNEGFRRVLLTPAPDPIRWVRLTGLGQFSAAELSFFAAP